MPKTTTGRFWHVAQLLDGVELQIVNSSGVLLERPVGYSNRREAEEDGEATGLPKWLGLPNRDTHGG